jgi:hypothetical protein
MRKDRELWQVERFKETCPEFPAGEIVSTEEPDFLVNASGVSFGIELTDLYRTDSDNKLPRQASESLRKQIVERAKKLYDESHGPELWVSVYFSAFESLSKSRVPDIANHLVTIVRAADVEVDGNVQVEADWDTSDFPEEINSIHIRRLSLLTKGFWNAPDAAFIPDCEPDQIQEIIDKKNKRITSYRNRCDVVWLLIVVDGFALSATVNFTESVRNHSFASSFDRVFIFENAAERSFELSLHSSTKCSTS